MQLDSALVYSKSTLDQITPCDVVLSCGDSDRSYTFNGLYYSPLIDSLSYFFQKQGLSVVNISDRISRYVGDSATNKPLTANRSLIFSRLVKRLMQTLKYSESKAEHWRINHESRLWTTALIRTRPRIVIGIQPDEALCCACHALNIPVFDLQHGVISDTQDNPYYYSNRLNRLRRDCLPGGFLCWDESSANTLASIHAFAGLERRIIGNPWFLRFKCRGEDDELVNKEVDGLNMGDNTLPIILVTLQFNLDEFASDYVFNGVMADSLESAIMASADKYRWLIRLHPSQRVGSEGERVLSYLEDKFGQFSNVDWGPVSKIALPILLSFTSVHLTHFSSTTIEAAWMGVPTGLIDPHMQAGMKHDCFYQDERRTGIATVLQPDGNSICKYIDEMMLAKRAMHGSLAMENLLSFIQDIQKTR